MFGIDFKSLKRTMESAQKKAQEMQTEFNDLRREWERVTSAPTSKEDLKLLLGDWVKSTGENYRKSLQETLLKFRNPRNLSSHELMRVMGITGAPYQGDSIRPEDVDRALCALFAPLLVKALLDEVDQMEWPADCLTANERKPKLDRIEQRMAQLQKDMKDLEATADEVGISLGI